MALLTVIVPALNEEESIGQVLRAIPAALAAEVIVADGGSADGTVDAGQSAGARVIIEPRHGYGRACAAGVAAARGEIVAFLDADGADDPGRLPDIVAPVLSRQADLSLGSRLAGEIAPGAMPWQQRLGNRLAAWLIRRLYGLSVSDLSPFRAVRRRRLGELEMHEMTYGWPTEMIVKAARRGWRVAEAPVRYRPRLAGRSKISGTVTGTVFAAYHILRLIFRYAHD